MKHFAGCAGLAIVAAFAVPLASPLPASAADTIVLGAAISITGKTAKEGEYTRDGYQFAIDTLNQSGGVKVGGKSYQLQL
jgi:branched-chain amino acid transport system substrate-binding protein